jgi:hypothetical protein
VVNPSLTGLLHYFLPLRQEEKRLVQVAAYSRLSKAIFLMMAFDL